jgi:hypothetical protein
MTMRIDPANPDRMIVATNGRGVYQYTFSDATQPLAQPLPNTTAAVGAALPLGVPAGVALLAWLGITRGRARDRVRNGRRRRL